MPFVKKPGFMLRAVIAWMIYNSILILPEKGLQVAGSTANPVGGR